MLSTTARHPRRLGKGPLTVSRWGGEVYFVYLPRFRRYYYESADETYMHRDRLLEALGHQGTRVIDFHQVVRELDGPLSLFPLRIRGHFNEIGYQLLARQICDALAPPQLSRRPLCDAIPKTPMH